MPPSIPSYLIQAFKNEDEDELDEGNDELNEWKDDLAKEIEAIEAYGDFASQKTYTTFVNPGLEVADVKIPLPLADLYADQIKAVARSAPFGRGDETVVCGWSDILRLYSCRNRVRRISSRSSSCP